MPVDIGHGCYGPKTGDRVRESNPGPTKRSCCKSGNQTLDPQKGLHARPGVRTLDRLKRSFVRSCTRSLNTIAYYDRADDRKISRARTCTNEFHVERVRWTTDDGQTDRKTDDGQTVSKMTKHPKRSCSLQNTSFSRYHIMYQITYIFTG